MKKKDYEACGLPAPDYFDSITDPNYDDGFYFPTDYHVPTPDDEEYWEDDEDDGDDDEDDGDDDEDENDDGEEDGDDPSTYAHYGDWKDEPENCAACADDECPLNRG